MNERGDGRIVPFEPFFKSFPRDMEKTAINRISLILPSRKEEREILFHFHRDQEIGSSRKKNALYKKLTSWSSTPSVTTNAPGSVKWDVSIYLSLDNSKWESRFEKGS